MLYITISKTGPWKNPTVTPCFVFITPGFIPGVMNSCTVYSDGLMSFAYLNGFSQRHVRIGGES